MFSKLLLVLGVAFANGSNLMLKANNNFSYTPNNSVRYDFIDYESPNYRLGDYEITQLEHISAGGGEVSFHRLNVIVPRVVFDTLGEYDNVFISMPLYDYNSTVDLTMRIDFYDGGVFVDPVISGFGGGYPLSMTMLKVFPYTMVDLPYNVFDSNNWDYDYEYELRVYIIVPYTAHTNPPGDYAEQLKNITLFTQRAVGELSYYDSGYSDGVNDGYDNGYLDGVNDGYEDGYQVGFSDAEAIADGSWLGSLVFGTIGGIVGFLFALSDFEVLGVSIMSIITLFVAIGIVRLLLKVLR